MNRIFKKTEDKPCSCSTGKKCSSCKKQKAIKPVVYIEEPRRLPASIVISRLTHKRFQKYKTEDSKAKEIKKLHEEEKKKVEKLDKLYVEEQKRIVKQRKLDEKKLRKEQEPEAAKKRLPSWRSWYRKSKALIRPEHDQPQERKDKEKVNENKALHALEEKEKAKVEKERRKLKEREATAKPLARSKYASAKNSSKSNKTLTYRFVNFCNKLCCQCYCYFSIIVIVGFMFLYLL